MASNERDPRKDPRPGDVLRDTEGITLIVRVGGGDIWWALAGQRNDELYEMPVAAWMKYSKDDEVLHVAE